MIDLPPAPVLLATLCLCFIPLEFRTLIFFQHTNQNDYSYKSVKKDSSSRNIRDQWFQFHPSLYGSFARTSAIRLQVCRSIVSSLPHDISHGSVDTSCVHWLLPETPLYSAARQLSVGSCFHGDPCYLLTLCSYCDEQWSIYVHFGVNKALFGNSHCRRWLWSSSQWPYHLSHVTSGLFRYNDGNLSSSTM
jgi:hypothetical protein